MATKPNDRALRFYQEVLGLDRLHYGLWREDDEISFANLKVAQQRYEDFLVDNIPQNVETLIDVGCGTGVMLERLKKSGYRIEGLTPDFNQQKILRDKGIDPIHACRFEEFQPTAEYDCIIMSESAQYIPLDRLFGVAKNALRSNGWLMVCDYFVRNQARGILAKSGHNFDRFLRAARNSGFTLVDSKDITEDILKTLRLAKYMAEKALLALDIGTEKIRNRYPFLTRLFFRLFKRKINRVEEEMQLIDVDNFRRNKSYQFLLFQLDVIEREG